MARQPKVVLSFGNRDNSLQSKSINVEGDINCDSIKGVMDDGYTIRGVARSESRHLTSACMGVHYLSHDAEREISTIEQSCHQMLVHWIHEDDERVPLS